MAFQHSDYTWSVRRNGRECARARTRREADRIVQQLQKIHRTAQFDVRYEGKNIPHCGEGGRSLE
ncbi:hypothetical protein C7B61_21670 [filamentous cyanobacterium CCP1]|jgi:hypothetical protein|nr:hypothetical protein C7B76_09530 [filamentous cyanobacterium CCP2]PSB55072.1 hypothetical protein C7B61_21670 [filamentous cyanobacterium CCP1]